MGRARWLGRPPVCSASLCARSVYVTECAHREAKLAELDTGSQGLPVQCPCRRASIEVLASPSLGMSAGRCQASARVRTSSTPLEMTLGASGRLRSRTGAALSWPGRVALTCGQIMPQPHRCGRSLRPIRCKQCQSIALAVPEPLGSLGRSCDLRYHSPRPSRQITAVRPMLVQRQRLRMSDR